MKFLLRMYIWPIFRLLKKTKEKVTAEDDEGAPIEHAKKVAYPYELVREAKKRGNAELREKFSTDILMGVRNMA